LGFVTTIVTGAGVGTSATGAAVTAGVAGVTDVAAVGLVSWLGTGGNGNSLPFGVGVPGRCGG
jgi:hypothetical protein